MGRQRMKDMIAYCGVDCSACPDYLNKTCPSCRLTEWKDDICPPVNCCREKNIDDCGQCDVFPCEMMKGFFEESQSHQEAYQRLRKRRESGMDHFVDERDHKLLENDRYTFSVLNRIMGGECQVLLSDHERLILGLSMPPFPVWIWTADDATDEEKEKAYSLAVSYCPFEEHTYNLKYDLAEYFIQRAAKEGKTLSIRTNMFAYGCPDPVEPEDKANGHAHRCTMEDVDTLVEFMDLFHNEIDLDKQSLDSYRRAAEEGIRNGSLFLWKNEEGKYVASCNYRPDEDMASIGLVYTRQEDRRKHYAENLVYYVTKIVKEAGYLPILYTDADYVASNACYEKIGYILRGKLCTVGKRS